MRSIRYKGTSDLRIISAADFASLGINDQGTTQWTRQQAISVSDLAAAYCLAFPTEFEDAVQATTFADLQQNSGKEIGYGGNNTTQAVTGTETDVPGVVCNVTPGADPFEICLDALVQINTSSATAVWNSLYIRIYDITGGGAGTVIITCTTKVSCISGGSALLNAKKGVTIRGATPGVLRTYKMTSQVTGTSASGALWAGAGTGEISLQALGR